MFDVILSFVTAFTLTYFAIPSIIHIARVKNLCDEPDERRSHTVTTPSLGGIGIFAGLIFSVILWTPFEVFGNLQYILCSFLLIFLMGAKDDIIPISPYKKLLGEVLAASILVFKSNIRLTSMYGILGFQEMPYWFSVLVTIFTILVIINAFNLIDGINGLAGSISIVIAATIGGWFFLVDHLEMSVLAFAMVGSVLAFLKYNVTPAKIFMGDTGSLLLGLVCSILAISFIETHNELPDSSAYKFDAAPAVAFGILILPLFDTLRVFTTRIMRGKSPLFPDRTHIHHLLLDSGLSHMQATTILVGVNVAFILLVLTFQRMGNSLLLALIIAIAVLMSVLLQFSVTRKKMRQAKSV